MIQKLAWAKICWLSQESVRYFDHHLLSIFNNTTSPHLSSLFPRFHHDVKKETSNDELYNDDDRNLIESIEKEFLITQDNFLPGQIVN